MLQMLLQYSMDMIDNLSSNRELQYLCYTTENPGVGGSTPPRATMKINLLKSKIHRATVTDANLDYEGSIGIDSVLMEAAGIIEYEKVQVLNITNGNRLETYAIKESPSTGIICMNGAAAHLVNTGDIIIIVSYCSLNENELPDFKPTIVLVDNNNNIKKMSHSIDHSLN